MSDAAPAGPDLVSAPAAVIFQALGTTVSVLTVDPAATGPAELMLRSELDELDQACSRFRPGSELSRAQMGRRTGAPVAISPLLTELLAAAIDVARFTDGAVDPTVGAAMARLGYDRDFDQVAEDGPALPDAPGPAPGWRVIELDVANRSLRLPQGTHLDLGSSAKAFAADRAASNIARAAGTGVLVNLGGDIAVAGVPPEGGWPIGLAACSATAPDQADLVVAMRGGGLASSGTGVRAWRRGGRLLHHIVDPRTGDVADGPWALVTVAASSCLIANAASTAAIVKGRAALPWLQTMGLPARLVNRDGGVVAVGGWPADPPPRASQPTPSLVPLCSKSSPGQ